MQDNIQYHIYRPEIQESDPMFGQPERVQTPLKPHQRAALMKAIVMERMGQHNMIGVPRPRGARGQEEGPVAGGGADSIETNVGVFGDIVGFGKTLIALSLIAANRPADISTRTRGLWQREGNRTHLTVTSEYYDHYDSTGLYIPSTLVVAPHGPVFMQWAKAVEQHTSLRILFLENVYAIRNKLPPPTATAQEIREALGSYDVVVVKNTMLKKLIQYYEVPQHARLSPVRAWARVMVDEAHDTLSGMPYVCFKFLWLITSSWSKLYECCGGTLDHMGSAIRWMVSRDIISMVTVRNNPDFVKKSFELPALTEKVYMCKRPYGVDRFQHLLPEDVQRMINANDFGGAVRALGGKEESETEIINLLTRGTERKIQNLQREIEFVRGQDIPDAEKKHRIESLEIKLKAQQIKMDSIKERLTVSDENTCPICMDVYEEPIVLPCVHMFCGSCYMDWVKNSKKYNCPTCRQPVDPSKLMHIAHKCENEASTSNAPVRKEDPSKSEVLLDIIRNKPNGRFLVFSTNDNTFDKVAAELEEKHITYAEMKGTTASMMKNLDGFRNGTIKVIMLNTRHMGSGIDISFATDVVLFHHLSDAVRTQAIGRAQRVGRTDPLTVHTLLYQGEVE